VDREPRGRAQGRRARDRRVPRALDRLDAPRRGLRGPPGRARRTRGPRARACAPPGRRAPRARARVPVSRDALNLRSWTAAPPRLSFIPSHAPEAGTRALPLSRARPLQFSARDFAARIAREDGPRRALMPT